jgi:hypothetical protein
MFSCIDFEAFQTSSGYLRTGYKGECMDLRERKPWEAGNNCIMKRLIITLH